MKKIITACVLSLITLFSKAQIIKQSVLLGGQFYYYNEKNKVDNYSQNYHNGVLSIAVGKAFKENRVFGISLSYNPAKESNFITISDTVNTTTKLYNIGLFYREYKKLAKDFYFFGEVDGGVLIADQNAVYSGQDRGFNFRRRGGFASLSLGVSYRVFKKMHVEITIPNIIYTQYAVTKIAAQGIFVKNSKNDQFVFSSVVTNNTSLGLLGVGFHFVL